MADEDLVFQSKWTEEYFFFCVKDVAVCLVFNGKISCFKEYNIKRRYETNHISQLSSLKGQSRKDKVNQLQKCLARQQNLFKGAALQSDTVVRASSVVSEILAQKKLNPSVTGK
jgi:hypothetical protein